MSFMQGSKEASVPKRRTGFIRIAAFTAMTLVVVYALISIISSNIKISEYEKQYEELAAQTAAIEDSNAEISGYLEEGADLDTYIEDMARDKLDYAKSDERVYYVVPDSGE